MSMLTLSICTVIFIIYLCMFLNFKFSAHLSTYIANVILGYSVVVIHIGEHAIPIDLIIVTFLGALLLHIKHKHLMQHRMSALLKTPLLCGFQTQRIHSGMFLH